MTAINESSKGLYQSLMILLISTTLLTSNLNSYGQERDFERENDILSIQIGNLKQDYRNQVAQSGALLIEIKELKDTTVKYKYIADNLRFKLSKADSTVNVQSIRIKALESTKSTLILVIVGIFIISALLIYFFVRKK
jgi:hypothetical protein